MKKILCLLLALCLAIPLFVACDSDDKRDGEPGEEHLEIGKTEAEKKMADLAAKDGYEITYSAHAVSDEEGETSTIVFGNKGGVMWMDLGGDGKAAYKKVDDGVLMFSNEDGKWEFMSKLPASDYEESFNDLADTFLFYGYLYDGSLTKDGTTTIAGRKCDEYSFKYTYLTYSYEYKLAVDQELGVTMAVHMAAKAEGESGTIDFEVTKFVTGDAVEMPELPEVKSLWEQIGLTMEQLKGGVITEFSSVIEIGNMLSANAKPATFDTANFNKWGKAVFDLCKSVSDDGKIGDGYGGELTEWEDKDGEMIYVSFSFFKNETEYSVTLGNYGENDCFSLMLGTN